jgi:hypothetical protein
MDTAEVRILFYSWARGSMINKMVIMLTLAILAACQEVKPKAGIT